MTVDEIRELINLAAETGIAELEVQRGENRVRIRRAAFAAPQEFAVAPAPATPPPPPSEPPKDKGHDQPPDPNLTLVKSPIVGTFYDSPSPGAPVFVKVGDQVEVGQVLCIVEAMKLMNEIESDVAGEVVKVLAENGQPVEYGERIFAIRVG